MRTKASAQKAQAKSVVATVPKSQSPPQLLKPLKPEDFRPSAREQQIIKELYEWEKQSAKVQFRVN